MEELRTFLDQAARAKKSMEQEIQEFKSALNEQQAANHVNSFINGKKFKKLITF